MKNGNVRVHRYKPTRHVVSHADKGIPGRRWIVWLEAVDENDSLYGELRPMAKMPFRRLALWWANHLDRRWGWR